MPAHRITWTPTMIRAFRSMRTQGMSLLRCAALLGVSYQVVVAKARELHIQGRRRGAAHRHLEARMALHQGDK